jgi:hypothetical protein
MSETSSERQVFALRMHEICDDLKLPKGRGRQTELGKLLEVTPKGARKWLTGAGWPEMDMAVRIANKAGVNVLWLLQGTGLKRGDRIDENTRTVVEAIERLPTEERGRVLNYLRFELQEHPGWFAEETRARYVSAIDALTRKPPSNAGPRAEMQQTHAKAA